MIISRVSVNRPVFAIMLTAAIIVTGWFSYRQLGLDLMPKTDPPVVNVSVSLPGASAEEIETQITKPIEEAVNTINGIDELRASSDEGSARVTITFVLERDIESATQDVRDKVATAVRNFPRDTLPPVIQKIDPDAAPILTLVVSGSRSAKELTEIVDKQIKQVLETVKDVGAITFIGDRHREIDLLLNADRLNAYGLTVDQVRQAVQRQDVEIPGGSFVSGPAEISVRTMGRIQNVDDFNRIILASSNGSAVTFGDIGRVVDTVQEIRSAARLDGQPAISLLIQKQSGTNTVDVVDGVLQRLDVDPRHAAVRHAGAADPRSVAVHPPLVRRHQAAPVSRRPARQPRRLPVHSECQGDAHRGARDSHVDHRHVHRHEGVRLHAEQHDDARALARRPASSSTMRSSCSRTSSGMSRRKT